MDTGREMYLFLKIHGSLLVGRISLTFKSVFLKKMYLFKRYMAPLLVGRISLYQGLRMRKGNLIICIL